MPPSRDREHCATNAVVGSSTLSGGTTYASLAEWLGAGLQTLLAQFDSAAALQGIAMRSSARDKQTRTAERARRRALGLCRECAAPSGSAVACALCRQKHREREALRYRSRQPGPPPVPSEYEGLPAATIDILQSLGRNA